MTIEDELTKKGIKYSINKLKLPRELSAFPGLDDVLNYFCRKNNISKPDNVISINKGLIVSWDNRNQIFLSGEIKGDLLSFMNPPLKDFFGRGRNHKYTSREETYELSGVLNGKKISLKSEIIYSQHYIFKENSRNSLRFTPKFLLEGKGKRDIIRKDNEKYWFLSGVRK